MLGIVDKCKHPNPDGGDMDEAEIARHGFIVAGRQPSRVLEFIEAALDAVAQGIDVPIDRDLNLAVPARGNDRRGAPFLQCFVNMIRIITAIGSRTLASGPSASIKGSKPE